MAKETKEMKETEGSEKVKTPEESTKKVKKPKKWWKVLLTVLGVIVGLIVVLIVALQIILSPAVLTKAVNDIAANFVDGEVVFGRAGVSMLRHFPNLSVTLDSVSITYPTERFADYETDSPLMKRGRGEVMDTLASFDHFSLSINLLPLISGNIALHSIDLDKPRIYAKSYAEGVANWNIFKFGGAQDIMDEILEEVGIDTEGLEEAQEEAAEEATESGVTEEPAEESSIPNISIGRIRLTRKPLIVFCSVPDDLYATVGFRNMQFRGKLTTANFYSNKLGFKLDSLYVFGRFQDDSLTFGLQKLYMNQVNGVINLDLLARARVATGSTGRMTLPLSIKSEFTLPKDTVPTISINSLVANFAGLPFKAKAEVKYFKDNLLIDADLAIDKCKVKDVIDNFGKNLWPDITNFRTDAVITMTASVHGPYYFDNSAIPAVSLSLDIPDTPVVNRKMKLDSRIGLALWAKGGGGATLDVGVDDLHFMGNTIQFEFKGGVADLLGKDPDFNLDTKLNMALDSLSKGIEAQFGYKVDGSLVAAAQGSVKKSQMDIYNFANADMWAFLRVNKLYATNKEGDLDFKLDSLSILAGTQENERNSEAEQGARLMSVGMKLDSVAVQYKDALALNAGDLHLSAWNDAAILSKDSEEAPIHPLSGTVKIGSLSMTDNNAIKLAILGSENKFTVKPLPQDNEIPVLTLTTNNESFKGKLDHNRVAFGDLNLSLTAQKTGAKRSKAAKAIVDSLAKRYSDVPRGELLAFAREKSSNIPDWLTEEDFKASDLDFKLDEAFAKYYKEWDFDGSLNLDRAILMTPVLPLRNTLTKVGMTINNNEFTLKNMTIKSGKSDFSAKGLISGLRQGLLNNGTISVEVSTHSDELNINEMLTAYTLGQKITAKLDSLSGAADALNDDDYMEMVAIDTISGTQAPKTPLLVIPGNLNAKITLDASKVAYSIIDMTTLHSDITMKERCLQVINTGANSNVGDLTFEAFYSTRTKQDISAGFNINFKDITAEKIVEMMPAVDTIMPMLSSFRGNLNCLLAATADIDTLMNIQLPSLEGVLRIQGQNVALVESEDLYKIAKILRFKDPNNITIDDMSVEALLKDNTIEIFPFLLSVGGRYKLAMSGVQNLDQSFKYHVSVIKSPLLIRFGVNFTGDDFSKMKFKIGKAVYKDENVQVFSHVIDETRLSLSDAIRSVFSKGVDATLRQAKDFSAIEDLKQSTNYVNPAEGDMEDLDEDEAGMYDNEENN